MTSPTPKNASVDHMPRFKSGVKLNRLDACEKASWINPSHRNKIPNPARIQPNAPNFFLKNICKKTPAPIIGMAKISTLILRPTSATNQPVILVPTFAPKRSQSEFAKVRIPALINPIARRVVAADDCKIVVAIKPDKKPLRRVLVVFSRNFTNVGPDAALSPSVMNIIPIRKSPTPPKNIPYGNSCMCIF